METLYLHRSRKPSALVLILPYLGISLNKFTSVRPYNDPPAYESVEKSSSHNKKDPLDIVRYVKCKLHMLIHVLLRELGTKLQQLTQMLRPNFPKLKICSMVKINKIYTRTGDDGTTGLVGGVRVNKNSKRVNCYGELDELNAPDGAAPAPTKYRRPL